MNKTIFLLLLIFVVTPLCSQFLVNKSGAEIRDQVLFNTDYIKNNNIKTITGDFLVKKDHRALIDFGTKYKYNFDRDGNIIYKMKVETIAQKWDTTEIAYTYNSIGKLIETRTRRKKGFRVQEFKYDSQDKHNVQVTNFLEGEDPDGKLKTQQNIQNFTWENQNDSTIVKNVANNFGQPYLKVIKYYDVDNNYLKKETHHFLVTNRKESIIYFYNEFGWLAKVDDSKSVMSYNYDELGNLLEVRVENDGDGDRKTEYLYKDNGILEAEIKTSIKDSDIYIVKYKIEYND